MNAILPLLTGIASGEAKHWVMRAKVSVAFALVMIVCLTVAAAFSLAAIAIVLAAEVGALEACLIIAGVALLLCVLTYVVHRVVAARVHRRAMLRRKAHMPVRLATAAVMAQGLVRSRSMMTLAIPLAIIGGALIYGRLGGRPEPDDAD